jgi:predicted lipoprotein
MRWLECAAALGLGVLLASCRFIPTAEVKKMGDTSLMNGQASFDPAKKVAAVWAAKVIPYFEQKAGPFVAVRDLAAKSPDEAGAKYGYRAKSDGTPWTLMVRVEGTIVVADTESRAATIGVDATGQGKTDATVQIGPAMFGTSIRDALSFVSFNDFTNQIDFARYGDAFNAYVNRITLEKLPRKDLVGRKVTLIGAYALDSSGEPPVITPVEITIGPKP